MNELHIYENYGVLAAEKRSVYTFGGPCYTAAAWDELTVQIPEGWEAYENASGETLIKAPWDWCYTVNELLIGDKDPEFYAVDDKQKVHRIVLRITEANIV